MGAVGRDGGRTHSSVHKIRVAAYVLVLCASCRWM